MHGAAQDSEQALTEDIGDFSTHDRKGGWALALVVARRVVPDKDHGRYRETGEPKRFDRNVYQRLSAREFARRSATATKRVLAYHAAWQRAAQDGVVPCAESLSPGTEVELPEEADVPFFGEGGYYRCYEARPMSQDRVDAIERESALAGIKPTSTAYAVQNPKALTVAMLADTNCMRAGKKAIAEFERRQAQGERSERTAAAKATSARIAEFEDAAESQDTTGQPAAPAPAATADPARAVFAYLAGVHDQAGQALVLLQANPDAFSPEQSRAIAKLGASCAESLKAICDLAASAHLGDDSIRSFVEQSREKLQ